MAFFAAPGGVGAVGVAVGSLELCFGGRHFMIRGSRQFEHPQTTGRATARNVIPESETTVSMSEATMELSSILEQPGFDAARHRALVEAAFATTNAFEKFTSLVGDLEEKLASGTAQGSEALKVGACYLVLEEPESALQWLQKAPKSAQRSMLLAELYFDMRRFDDAANEYDAAASQGADRVEAELKKAGALVAGGKFDAAAAILKQHQNLESTSSDWMFVNGLLNESRGDTHGAIAAFEKAVAHNENHSQAAFRLAYLLDLHGEDEEAREWYERCAEMPRVHVNTLINLAILSEDEGDYDMAESCLRRVLQVNPNHPRASLYLKDVVAAQSMFYDEFQHKVQQQHDAVLDIPVTDFELSVRSRNCLKKMNIFTLGDLLRISERELLAYKNFGETSLKEIKAMLVQKGLSLGQLASEQIVLPRAAPTTPQPEGNPEVLSRPVSTLELSVRSRKCLQRLGINTVGELAGTSENELLSSKNFGQTSLTEIKGRLAELGISLRASN